MTFLCSYVQSGAVNLEHVLANDDGHFALAHADLAELCTSTGDSNRAPHARQLQVASTAPRTRSSCRR